MTVTTWAWSGWVGFSLLLATSASYANEDEHWRLFVADHSEPMVRAVDLDSGGVLGAFAVKAPASLYKSESGRTVFAVQGDGNVVSAIASGLSFKDHGDHGDMEVSEPRLLDVSFEGAKPSHFVAHDGQIALFFDGDGKVSITTEARILDGKAEAETIATEAPHHGAAATVGEHVLVTIPHPEDPSEELPIGVRVLDKDGNQVGGAHDCPDLHGEAASGNLLAFACAAGLLLVERGDKEPSIRLLPYSSSLPEGKVTTLRGGVALQYFLGNYGPDAVVLVEPSGDEPFRLVKLPSRRVDFTIDPAHPERVYIFTEDGHIHRLNAVTGAIVKSAKLTQPYSMDGHWRDPRPRLAVAGGSVIVTDPLAGVLRVVDPETLAETRSIDVDGKPYTIVAIGGSGETH